MDKQSMRSGPGALLACCAGALILIAGTPAWAAAPGPGTAAQSPADEPPSDALRNAVALLDQAALQHEVSADPGVLGLLRSAQDALHASQARLCCAMRDRASQLEADVARLVARGERQSATLDSTGGAIADMPNRDQLVAIAREGQELLRGAPSPVEPLGEQARLVARAQQDATVAPAVDEPPATTAGRLFADIGGPSARPLFSMQF